MGRSRKDHREPVEETILPYGEYFPNGLPKVCTWYAERDDIRYVIGREGEELPVLENHWLMLDFKKGMNIYNHFELCRASEYDTTTPVRENLYTDYANSEAEAEESAVNEQGRLAEEGVFVPIFVRD